MCKSRARPETSDESSKVRAQTNDHLRETIGEETHATTSRAADLVIVHTAQFDFTSTDIDSSQTSSSFASASSSSSTEFIIANDEDLQEAALGEVTTEVMRQTAAVVDDDAESRTGGGSSNASLFQRISVGERLSQMLRLVAVSDGNDESSCGGNNRSDEGAEVFSITSCDDDSSTEGWNLVVDKAIGNTSQSSGDSSGKNFSWCGEVTTNSLKDVDPRCELTACNIHVQFASAAARAHSDATPSSSTTATVATNLSDNKSSDSSVQRSSDRKKVTEIERRLSALVIEKMGLDGQPPSVRGQNQEEEEVVFRPPWSCSLGQMQECVRTLQRNAEEYCRNRNIIVVFCHSKVTHISTYLVQVLNQIKDVLSTSSDYQLECVQPVFLPPSSLDLTVMKKINSKFSTETIFRSTESIQEAAKAISDVLINSASNEAEQRIIIKLQFNYSCPLAAANFREAFNSKRASRQEFMQESSAGTHDLPLAQWALTYPERQLRRALNAHCRETNRSREALLSHDGVQLFKRNIGVHAHLVRFEPNTKLQNLHAAVVSLRKFAETYRTKRLCVIVRNVSELSDATEDVKLLWSLALRIVNTDEFRRLAAVDDAEKSSLIVGVKRVPRGVSLPFPRLVRFTLRDAACARHFIYVFNQRFRVEANGGRDIRGHLAVAHADLSAPELALRYALLAFCREQNAHRVSAYKYACNPQHHRPPPAPRSRDVDKADDHPNCVYFFRQWRLFRVQQNSA